MLAPNIKCLADYVTVESQVALYPLPALAPPTPLIKAKTAFSFTIHSSVQLSSDGSTDPSTGSDFGKSKSIPTLVSQLAIGCQRKFVLYSWKDGEPQDVQVRNHGQGVRRLADHDMDRKLRCHIRQEQWYI